MTKTKSFLFWLLILVCLLGIAFGIARAESPDSKQQPLTELEHERFLRISAQQQKNSAQAALIRSNFEANQAEGKRLQDEARDIFTNACSAHGIDPARCELSTDGTSLHERPGPQPAPANKPKP